MRTPAAPSPPTAVEVEVIHTAISPSEVTPATLPALNHEAELDAILEQVEAAGLVEQYVDDEGRPAMRLTSEGVRVARQLAMLGEDGQDALMAALLGRWIVPRDEALVSVAFLDMQAPARCRAEPQGRGPPDPVVRCRARQPSGSAGARRG